MAQTTIEQFATELKMPPSALIEQLASAGVATKKSGDELTEQDKTRLLDYLRKQHGAATEPKKRITLTRRQTTEIKAPDAANKGKSRTIQVEVRKKRVLERRDAPEAPVEEVAAAAPVVEAPQPAPAAPALPAVAQPVISAEEMAAREAEEKRAREFISRQEEDLKRRQEEQEKRKTRKEREAEEAARVAAEAKAAQEAKVAEEAKAAAQKTVDAKARPGAPVKTEGTLHRPAGKAGERKDKPIEGMNIMWGVHQDDDVWSGGHILDPKTGKVYKVKLSMLDGGQKLNVRGYIGFSWVGRSQQWERQP